MAKSSLIGRIAFDLVANTGNLLAPLRVAQKAVEGFGASVKSHVGGALGSIRSAASSTSAQLLGLGGALSAGGLVAYAMKQAVAYEDASVAIKTFLGDAAKAKAFMAEMKQFSDVTPFTADEVTDAGKKLLAFGFNAGDVVNTMKYLGDAAAATGNRMEDLVVIIGQIRMKQRLMGEEVLQLHERGIPITNALAQLYGKSAAEITKMVSAGKVGFADVTAAMKLMNAEGGLFYKSMEALSGTTSGKLSTLKSAFDGIMREVGTIILEGFDVKGFTDRITGMVTQYRDAIIEATQAAVNAILIGAEYAAKAINWIAETIHYVQIAWKAMQLGAQLALTGAVDLAALLVQGFEVAIEGIATGFNWLWGNTRQGLTEVLSFMITKIADFMSWMDSKLPESMQTGLGKAATEFATAYEQIAAENRRVMETGGFKVDLNMGAETSRAFADNMLDQASQANKDFWEFVEKGPDVAKVEESMQTAMEDMKTATADAITNPLRDGGGASDKSLSVGALERGSAAAMSAIVGTQKSLSLDQQNLEAQKRHTTLLNSIERNTRTSLAPAGL